MTVIGFVWFGGYILDQLGLAQGVIGALAVFFLLAGTLAVGQEVTKRARSEAQRAIAERQTLQPKGLEPSRRREAISARVRREVWNRDGGSCVTCGSRERLEFDHIIPVADGGSNTARNLELLCERCNRSKGKSLGK